MKTLLLLIVFFSTLASAAPYQVASHQQTFHNGERVLTGWVRYPTTPPDEQRAASAPAPECLSTVFNCINTHLDAPAAAGRFPLIVLSHGSGGNATSQAWLAQALVQQGAIVVAVNHPGSTTGDSIPARSARLWQQTQDISALITAVSQDPRWRQHINPNAIGVIGHSKGGYSAIAAIGGRITREGFAHGCRQAPATPSCQFYTAAGVDLSALPAQQMDADYTDPRIRFAIALDPGMVHYLSPSSLRRLSAPLLVIVPQHYMEGNTVGNLGGAKLAADSGKYPIRTLTLPGGNHFDFLPTCTPAAKSILEADGEAFICATPAAQRDEFHQQVIRAAVDFIRPWLPPHSA